MLKLTLPKLLAFLILATSAAIFCFRPLTPAIPQIGLDASWVVVMGEAAERHLRWGTDLAFPYGPASSLLTKYDSSIYLSRVLPLIVLISVLFAWGTVLLIEAGGADQRRRGVPASAVLTLAIAVAGTRGFPDAFFLTLPLLPFLLALDDRSFPRAAEQLVVVSGLAAMAGVAGMGKMSVLLCALPLFVVADLALLTRGRLPVLSLPLAAGFAAAAVIFGQSLVDLPAGLLLQWSVVTGYSEAMAADGSRWELGLFVIASGLLLLLVGRAEARAGDAPVRSAGRRGAFRTLGVGFVLFLLFKAGFVRQDLHTLIAWNGLALTAALAILSRFRRWRRGVAGGALVAAMAIVLVVCPAILISQRPPGQRMAGATTLFRTWFADEPLDQVLTAARALTAPADFVREVDGEKAAAWAKIVDLFPLPRLSGRVDTIPSLQSRVIANGLDYRPRPSFQEYATYAAPLAEANRRFVEGPLAPDWILFGAEPGGASLTLDRRFPNLAEGALWPDLLRLYRPARRIEALLALQRRARPAETSVGSSHLVRTGFNRPIEVPAGAPAFVRIALHRNLLGRIADLLFRPAPVVLTVRFADQHRASYQYIGGLGEAGFVVSPLVTDADDFEALADGKVAPDDRAVAAFSIDATWKMQVFFAPEIDVEMSALRVEPAEALAPDAGLP